jgi:hypothetical protein
MDAEADLFFLWQAFRCQLLQGIKIVTRDGLVFCNRPAEGVQNKGPCSTQSIHGVVVDFDSSSKKIVYVIVEFDYMIIFFRWEREEEFFRWVWGIAICWSSLDLRQKMLMRAVEFSWFPIRVVG